jgi:hypothetical protein
MSSRTNAYSIERQTPQARHAILTTPGDLTRNCRDQDMLCHAQYSTAASIYQHVATEDLFAAAQPLRTRIEKALTG